MSWKFEEYFKDLIVKAQKDVGLSSFDIEVCLEQNFVKKEFMEEDTIYVVIKYLTSEISFGVITQPLQIMVLSEQNSLEAAKIIFDYVAVQNNFKICKYVDEKGNNNIVKQQYATPVVLSNFNEAAYGYRSVMYLSATLYIMENIIDVENVKIGFDDIFKDLTSDQITVKNGILTGELNEPLSLKYILDVKDFYSMLIEGMPIALYYHGYDQGQTSDDEHGYLIVNGIQCFSFMISKYSATATRCLLQGANAETIEIFDYGNEGIITIQVMDTQSMSYGTFSYSGGETYLSVINTITKYIYKDAYEEDIKALNFNIAYSMTPNTQPIPPERIATSVKSVATFSISFTTAMTSNYQYVDYVSNIMKGEYSGNINFYISFDLGDAHFVRVPMKLISVQVITAIDEVPGLQIGLIR